MIFTSLHFTSLHFTSLHFTSLHFTSLHYTLQWFSAHFIFLQLTAIIAFLTLFFKRGVAVRAQNLTNVISSYGTQLIFITSYCTQVTFISSYCTQLIFISSYCTQLIFISSYCTQVIFISSYCKQLIFISNYCTQVIFYWPALLEWHYFIRQLETLLMQTNLGDGRQSSTCRTSRVTLKLLSRFHFNVMQLIKRCSYTVNKTLQQLTCCCLHSL